MNHSRDHLIHDTVITKKGIDLWTLIKIHGHQKKDLGITNAAYRGLYLTLGPFNK